MCSGTTMTLISTQKSVEDPLVTIILPHFTLFMPFVCFQSRSSICLHNRQEFPIQLNCGDGWFFFSRATKASQGQVGSTIHALVTSIDFAQNHLFSQRIRYAHGGGNLFIDIFWVEPSDECPILDPTLGRKGRFFDWYLGWLSVLSSPRQFSPSNGGKECVDSMTLNYLAQVRLNSEYPVLFWPSSESESKMTFPRDMFDRTWDGIRPICEEERDRYSTRLTKIKASSGMLIRYPAEGCSGN